MLGLLGQFLCPCLMLHSMQSDKRLLPTFNNYQHYPFKFSVLYLLYHILSCQVQPCIILCSYRLTIHDALCCAEAYSFYMCSSTHMHVQIHTHAHTHTPIHTYTHKHTHKHRHIMYKDQINIGFDISLNCGIYLGCSCNAIVIPQQLST